MKHDVTVQFFKIRLAPDFSPVFLSLIFLEPSTTFLYIAQKEFRVNLIANTASKIFVHATCSGALE